MAVGQEQLSLSAAAAQYSTAVKWLGWMTHNTQSLAWSSPRMCMYVCLIYSRIGRLLFDLTPWHDTVTNVSARRGSYVDIYLPDRSFGFNFNISISILTDDICDDILHRLCHHPSVIKSQPYYLHWWILGGSLLIIWRIEGLWVRWWIQKCQLPISGHW